MYYAAPFSMPSLCKGRWLAEGGTEGLFSFHRQTHPPGVTKTPGGCHLFVRPSSGRIKQRGSYYIQI